MKKTGMIVGLIVIFIAGGLWYVLSGAGNFIRGQIEQQGSYYLATPVSVAAVELALTEGRMTISELVVKNPAGFSDNNAFSLDAVTLDLGEIVSEPYAVEKIEVLSPTILFEMDADGQGNLLALKNSIAAQLPKTETTEPTQKGSNPLVIVEKVVVSQVKLMLNFEALPTGEINIDKKAYELTMPTFTAGPIGAPNGLPADKVGMAIVDTILVQVSAAAKAELKKRLADEAKKQMADKLAEEKDKLLDKASEKLKGLFN